MGDARRRKLAGSGPVPPKECIVPVARSRKMGIVGHGRSSMLSSLALMMTMAQDYPELPTKGKRIFK